MPQNMSQDMPEEMPDRMPEKLSDRTPENLLVKKYIIIMITIIRSKIIYFK